MPKYPDTVIILKVNGNGPYEKPVREQVYTGRCRVFLDRAARFRLERVMNSTYKVVIPDRSMPEIGENYVIAVRFHNNPSTIYWDKVGYVKDFARYERVCEIIFELVKENTIYEDIPGPSLEQGTQRKLAFIEDEWLHIESAGLTNGGAVAEEPIHIIRPEKPWIDPEDPETQWNVELKLRWWNETIEHPEGEWVDVTYGNGIIVRSTSLYYDPNDSNEHHLVFVPEYPVSDVVGKEYDNVLHICLLHPTANGGEPEVFYDREIAIFEHKY